MHMNDIVCGVYVHVRMYVCMYVTGLWLCMCIIICVYVSLGCGPTPPAVFLLFGAVHVPSIDLACTTIKNIYTLWHNVIYILLITVQPLILNKTCASWGHQISIASYSKSYLGVAMPLRGTCRNFRMHHDRVVTIMHVKCIQKLSHARFCF